MTSVSFIDFVYPQFPAPSWHSGVSIFHSDGVSNLKIYGELVSARVKAGIGENYDVRLKLHAHGKCVQWMECTCQAYRRKGVKCPHIAALCIYLDQEKPDILMSMNLGAGHSDIYLLGSSLQNKSGLDVPHKAVNSSDLPVDYTLPPIAKRLDSADANASDVERSLGGKITEVVQAKDDNLLRVTIALTGGKAITYRLAPDEAYQIITDPRFKKIVPDNLIKLSKENSFAKRVFDVQRAGEHGLKISRCVAIYNKAGEEKKLLKIENIPKECLALQTVFLKEFGFVRFADRITSSQLARWDEYPQTALLDDDSAAALFETKFSRLRETAELVIDKSLANVQVFSKLEIPELRLNSAEDGFFLVDPKFMGLSAKEMGADENTLLAIIRARAEGKKFLRTKNGWVSLSDDIDWLQGKLQKNGQLKLSTLELIRFREQFASESKLTGNGDLIEKLKSGLISSKDLKLPSLARTQLSLRPYQEEGVKWLWWLYNNGLGGLLADEMGLGKTHQAMGLLAAVASKEPNKLSLVVCPTSVIDHWVDKMQQFIPNMKVVFYHGTNRRQEWLEHPKEHTVVVTSYGILLRDILFLMNCPWSVVILDEAHLVKNQSTRTYKAAVRLASKMRLCLTGTPLENDLLELKNLFDYLAPGYLGSDTEFKRKYMAAGERGEANALADLQLRRLIHPFKMRRNKRDVLKDLPEKVEDIKHCHLKKDQHKLYMEALSLKGAQLVGVLRAEAEPIPYIHVFSVISLLKQICDDPALVDPKYEGVGSGKLDLFDEILQEALESDQKVVVFSQYAKMIDRLSLRLGDRGIKHVTLTGRSTKRGNIIREFQENNEVKVFLGSLLAGGTGIDLTAANVVIHFDRWWNAAKEDQATDRVHRVGQGRNVQVYKLVTRGTLEERIDAIISRKKIVFDRFMEQDSEVFKNLTREDLLSLLAPPEELTDIDSEDKEGLALPDPNIDDFAQILDV